MARWTTADFASPFRTLYTIDSERPEICAASSGTPPWSRLRLRLGAVFLYTLAMLFSLVLLRWTTRRAFDPA